MLQVIVSWVGWHCPLGQMALPGCSMHTATGRTRPPAVVEPCREQTEPCREMAVQQEENQMGPKASTLGIQAAWSHCLQLCEDPDV